ncbi:MAG TPA: M13 family metallopeptidase [Candidatus Paceibacterota bacterium]|jgi:putative endopeptidase|nr:M13 family metallopeptidase [Candidatus Paceibacterota bacterium]
MDPNDFDLSAKPADDFFQYVNGGWIAHNPIPADEARWGSFIVLRVEVEKQLLAILAGLVARGDIAPGSNVQKVRDFYLTAMDREARNRLGVTPLAELQGVIATFSDKKELPRVVARLHAAGASVFLSPFVDQDEKQSGTMALHLYQGGLGLPDRDYYLNDDEKSREIRKKYQEYIVALLRAAGAGVDECVRAAAVIFGIEKRLAEASRTRVALRDVHKQYNKVDRAGLAALTPSFAWADYFAGLSLPVPQYFIVGQPEFFEAIERVLAEFSLEDVKAYLSWHLLNEMAGVLTEELEKLNFDFYGRTFSGTTEMKSPERRALRAVNGLLDEAMGELYVEKHFSPDAKQKITVLVDRLIEAYRARIARLDWMAEETKQKALAKLSRFSRKLGYPDKWKDIKDLIITSDSYAANCMRAHAFEFVRRLRKVDGPVDRGEWLMPPQMVNAYYQPPMNEIVFPAAILQPPFFDPAAEDALNYGGIGCVIGHELTHGFDDQGAFFNGDGNLENWWTKEDKERFDARTARLAEQFDAYEVLPDLHVNGKLTLGENIADLGGIIIAYDALRLAQGGVADPGVLQNFFMNCAVGERGSEREEYLRLIIQTDPHSPGKCRVNGPLSNLQEFYDAFGVKPGDKMWREPSNRIKIW